VQASTQKQLICCRARFLPETDFDEFSVSGRHLRGLLLVHHLHHKLASVSAFSKNGRVQAKYL
jgi:hypothetical protein